MIKRNYLYQKLESPQMLIKKINITKQNMNMLEAKINELYHEIVTYFKKYYQELRISNYKKYYFLFQS